MTLTLFERLFEDTPETSFLYSIGNDRAIPTLERDRDGPDCREVEVSG